MDCHWQALNEGKWFRVIAGTFETEEQAARYKADNGLNASMTISAPFTVQVMPDKMDIPSAEISEMLAQIGYDCQLEADGQGGSACYTGVFTSRQNALQTEQRINNADGLFAQVVRRQQIITSEQGLP